MFDPLFQPITINTLEIKNRIFMPAMNLNMARQFMVTDQLVQFYEVRARGGAGMITVGYATVDEFSGYPSIIGCHRDEFVPGLARLAAAIRDNGARAAVQLNHAGRYNHSFFLGGKKPVAPSPLASRLTKETPHELTEEEINGVIQRFARAAQRVKEAGFDAVEILSGTGYLISEFLSPLTNIRTDRYGGQLENRMRFGVEVLQAVRSAVGAGYPIVVRLNGNEFMEKGTSRQDLQEYAVRLSAEGANALCINVGWHEARVPQIVTEVPRGVFGYLARGVKERVAVPVIASHRINDPGVARELIANGMCDAVAMGRALIADPLLPEKARTGCEHDIVHCVACGQACFDNLLKMKAVECLCNPRVGYEQTRTVGKTERPLNIMTIGGGAAGMSAAIAAAERGHHVSLYERGSRLGGQLLLADAPPGRQEFLVLARDLARQVELRGIRVVLNREVDAALLAETRPDAVILATGGISITPQIPGADLPHVVQAWDVLNGSAPTGRRVVIVGGGAVGVETALFLAEKGTLSGEELKFLLIHNAESPGELARLAVTGTKDITLIEMLDDIGKNFGKTTRWAMLQDVERFKVKTRTSVRALGITASAVRIEGASGIEEIPADTVVLAAGTKAYNPLKELVVREGIPFRIVGDASSPATVFDAIHNGFLAGAGIG